MFDEDTINSGLGLFPSPDNLQKVNIVMVGDQGAGKTNMLVSYCNNDYPTEYKPTVHDYYTVRLGIDGRQTSVQLIDTAGKPEFGLFRRLSYPDAEVFLLCFDVCDPRAFARVRDYWLMELKDYKRKTPVILVGTQIDRRSDFNEIARLSRQNLRPITTQQGQQMARKIRAKKYIECSALTKKNLKSVFDSAIVAGLDEQLKLQKRLHASSRLSLHNLSFRRLSDELRKSLRSLEKRSSTHSGSSRSSAGSSNASSRDSSSGSSNSSSDESDYTKPTYSKTFNPDALPSRPRPFLNFLCMR